jgi:putative transposase
MQAPTFRRRDLPHWDMPGAAFFVTSCLKGSIPARGLIELQLYQQELDARPRPDDLSEDEWKSRRWKLRFARLDRLLDEESDARWLDRPDLAEVVVSSMLHFSGVRYEVLAFVVMPSHFHWVFRPIDEWVAGMTPTELRRSPREQVMHSVKKWTSRRCNEILGRKGPFWQSESYDHWIRDFAELERIIRYVEDNPVKAALVKNPEDWRFSSAHMRRLQHLTFGHAIRGGRSPNLPKSSG